MPGGGIEEKEDEFTALKREILEETGCTCDNIEQLGIVYENRFHQDYTSCSYYFAVNTGSLGERTCLTEKEIENGTGVQWCTFEELIHLIRDRVHDTTQRRFIQARDMAALDEYCKRYLPERVLKEE